MTKHVPERFASVEVVSGDRQHPAVPSTGAAKQGVAQWQVPWLTILLMVLNVVVFVYWQRLPATPPPTAAPTPVATPQDVFILRWAVIPLEITEQDLDPRTPVATVVTLVTSLFLHGDWLHLGSNMFYLWVFGKRVEQGLGHVQYLVVYLVCGIAGSLLHVALVPASLIPLLGASGAVAGVMVAHLVLFPKATLRWWIFGFWLVLQLLSSRGIVSPTQQWTGGVALWSHIAGLTMGMLLALGWRFKGSSTRTV